MVFFGLGVFIRPPTFGIACIDAHSIRDGRGRPRSLGDEPNGWSNYQTQFVGENGAPCGTAVCPVTASLEVRARYNRQRGPRVPGVEGD